MCDALSRPLSPVTYCRAFAGLFREGGLPFHHTYIWPKLVHVLTACVCAILGETPRVMIHANLIFFAILLVSIYLTGKRCASMGAGLFAAALVSLYPAIYGQSRKFGLDFPLTAMTTLCMCLLMRTDYFNRSLPSLSFGVALGLAILTKGQVVLYIAAPMMVALLVGLYQGSPDKRTKPLTNGTIAVIVALAVSSIWWWGIWRDLVRAYYITVTDYPFSWAYAYQKQPAWTIRWLLFHAVHCVINISPFFTLVAAVALPSFLRRQGRCRGLILSWVIGTYAIWTLSNIKRDTDFMPCLPAIALISGVGIAGWRRAPARRIVIALCVIVGMAQFFSVSFSQAGYRFWDMPNPYHKPSEPDGYSTLFQPPYPNNYEAIAAALAPKLETAGRWDRYSRVGLVETEGDERWLEYQPAIFEYYLRLRCKGGIIYRSRYSPEAFVEHARSFKYLIVMDRGEGETAAWGELESFYAEPRWDAMIAKAYGSRAAFRQACQDFRHYRIIARGVLMPDRVRVFLYERLSIPVAAGSEIMASAYDCSDLLTTPSVIGPRDLPRHVPLIPEYDAAFPFWLRFPLVEADLRYPGDPYFCEYAIDSSRSGEYHLSLRYAWQHGGAIRLSIDGTVTEVRLEATGGGGHWARGDAGTISLSPGPHRLLLEGGYDFPLLAGVRFDKL